MQNPYESPQIVDDYLFFHYATLEETCGDLPVPQEAWGFPVRLVHELLDTSKPLESALDVGCAVGASSFELARHAAHVVGVDFSKAFIDSAIALKANARLQASVPAEGKKRQHFSACIPQDIDRGRVTFETGDAMALRTDLGCFDVVLAANLLCRLPDPLQFLDRLPGLVRTGGQLLLATPFSWLPEYTPEEKWLGGRPDTPSSIEILKQKLSSHFIMELETNIPFLIREHSRKFQYGISLGTRWRRR